jgi:hypothetical protein
MPLLPLYAVLAWEGTLPSPLTSKVCLLTPGRMKNQTIHSISCVTIIWQTRGDRISSPKLATRAWLLSFNRTQSRVIIGLLTGHNTLWTHLHVMGLINNSTCRKCCTVDETLVHILCECEELASLRHAHLGSFFLEPECIRKLSAGAIWNCDKGTGRL